MIWMPERQLMTRLKKRRLHGNDWRACLRHDGGESMQSARPTDRLPEMRKITYHIRLHGKSLMD